MTEPAINRDKMLKVLQWFSENVQKHPEKSRLDILREAEIRFDLSPKECTFLDDHFAESQDTNCR